MHKGFDLIPRNYPLSKEFVDKIWYFLASVTPHNGLAVKFFLQKDLSQETQAEICEIITSLGGRVEAKVPRQGYILVQPGTAEEERLRLCWTSADRPERHFVPYTYVEACKIAGMLLKQIFVHDGLPIKMHIHPSIANVNARTALSHRIMHSGGDPTASAQSARIILADPNTEVFQHLVKVYQGNSDKYIESYLWVKKCVEKGALVYTPLVYKNPGGRRPGEERTQFTEDDEEHLAVWIAAKIPYKETGGRTGNRLYQQLCEMSADPEYAWVSRHTWQSWRERYKKNATRLDTLIAAIVEKKKPAQGEKGQYGYVRQAEAKSKRGRRKRGGRNQEFHGSDDEFGEHDMPMPMPVVYAIPMDASYGPGVPHQLTYGPLPPGMSLPMPAPPPNGGMHAPGGGPLDASSVRKSPAEEEMDDGEDDPDFAAVRVGNAPPPPWGKRKATEDLEDQSSNKRRKSSENHVPVAPPGRPNGNGDSSLLHVIDQSIRDIAKEFRFTVEEVQEYYDKCGEMGRTRSRFERMRRELSKLADDNDD
ncbi:hypothetical protein PILCRDRAFT_778079 [Piloderma croceum F 1598]|uniref:DNA-binding protein RAP1 n=1 Tax=Piloderma croceum (strain F 1598) TaxID=765440 RepID=A0A0C3C6R7_PILCF|nr:hypothetical protein PILCRDRAFT_778079 [Piloderma croceum F 1598]